MKQFAQITIVLLGLIYGTAFSLCTLVTLGDLFYRKVRRVIIFPVIAGVIFGIAFFLQNKLIGGLFPLPLYLLHTAAAFFLLTERKKADLLPLICAELFSGCMIGSMQTALFSVTNGAERSFIPVTLLYLGGFLAAVLFVFLLKRLVRSEGREPLGLLQIILLTSISCVVTSLVSRSFTMSDYVPDVSPEAAIPSVLMLMSVSVLLLLSVKTDQAKRFREVSELSEKYMTAQAKHFEQSRAADTEMRMFRHDMKNHITVMNGLFDSGKTEELGEYLKELGNNFSDTQSANFTGSEIADAIIYEKKKYAETNGVSLVTEGSLKGAEIGAVTLCTVLSNLLDNAVEAASQTDAERVVDLSARKSGSFYYICITNPTADHVDVSADIPTSKPDSAGHGLGLKSVRKAAEKCGGTLELSCKEAARGYVFTAEVILPAKQ
ncbi:MAG: GHKL domain-containing protein [Ruminococcus sp.]|nr:GHKL domain-containing protein [Ruminococcus sp.]